MTQEQHEVILCSSRQNDPDLLRVPKATAARVVLHGFELAENQQLYIRMTVPTKVLLVYIQAVPLLLKTEAVEIAKLIMLLFAQNHPREAMGAKPLMV